MANRTCIADDCDRPARTRSWCSMHYSRWYNAGADPATATPKIGRPRLRAGSDPCVIEGCDRSMKTRDMCEKHYARWWRAARRDGRTRPVAIPSPPITEIPCPHCGTTFMPTRRSNAYCSASCRSGFGRKNNRRICSIDGCDRRHMARDVCQNHYKLLFRAPARRRRLPDGGINAENILRRDIGDRDGWTCGICHGPIDPTLVWPDPKSQSLDHIIPVSKGGQHRESNVRIAHVGCNAARGNRDDPFATPQVSV